MSKSKEQDRVSKGQIRDLNSRTVFKDPILCAQFLRDYTGISLLKNVQPEDIEDVSEKYQAYLGISFETDTVAKVRIREHEEGIPLFMISLFEHKSQVDYNVTMQLLRYMVCIWTEYAKEMQRSGKGNSANKGFKYPPILPIVYYEGTDEWTVNLHLKDRIMMSEIFMEYLPDFTYKLVRNHDYSNEELLEHKDEMSLLMMINKVQTPEDMEAFLSSQKEKINEIVRNAPEHIVEIIASAIWSLCIKMNVPQDEAKQCVEKVRERQMGYWFENVKMDIQAERRNAEKAREMAAAAEQKAEEAERRAEERERKAKQWVIEAEQKAEEAERRAEERERKAKQWVIEAEQKAVEAEQKAVEAEQKVIEAEQKAAEIISNLEEERIKITVTLCQEYGATMEEVVERVIEQCDMERESVAQIVQKYWKK